MRRFWKCRGPTGWAGRERPTIWISIRKETVLERLGTKVRAIPRDTFNQLFDRMPVNEEVKDVASSFRRGAKKVIEPNWQDSLNSARAYTTAKRLLADEKANALSMDCLGMVAAKLVPTPPCGAWTILQDQGVTAGCEADLFGAITPSRPWACPCRCSGRRARQSR
jgi:L-fucose isomerase-like protein